MVGASVWVRPAGEVELVHGYTLEEVNRLAWFAVRQQRWGLHATLGESADVAWSAIVEHLYASEDRPEPRDVVRVAWSAVSDDVARYRRFYGLDSHDRYAGVMGAFERFWVSSVTPTRSPEDSIVEWAALWQIWEALSPADQQVLAALAEHEDYGRAAEALGKSRKTFTSQLSQARQAFLALWHQGEQPSRPWGHDRRKSADSTDRHASTYVLRIRKRHLAKRTQANGGTPPPPRVYTGRPKRDLGITREELERRYQGGESIRAIAASLGCSYSVLHRHTHAEGIQPRPAGNTLRTPKSRTPKEATVT